MQCQACGSLSLKKFFYKENVPILQNVLYKTKDEAENAECGVLDLRACEVCGMVQNVAFKGAPYSTNYENTQFHSATFLNYAKSIIKMLVEKYRIKRTKIIEIGCGNGEFLSMLASVSESSGIGYDPSYSTKKAFTTKDAFKKMGGGRIAKLT